MKKLLLLLLLFSVNVYSIELKLNCSTNLTYTYSFSDKVETERGNSIIEIIDDGKYKSIDITSDIEMINNIIVSTENLKNDEVKKTFKDYSDTNKWDIRNIHIFQKHP